MDFVPLAFVILVVFVCILRFVWLFLALVFVDCAASGVRADSADAAGKVRLAVVNTYGQTLMRAYFSETIETIREEIKPKTLDVHWFSPQSFLKAASKGEFDIAIASSGLSHVMADRNAGTLLLSSVRDAAPDPAHANGAVIVVRADRFEINSLEDLRGKSLAIMSKKAFAGWQVPAAEFIRNGIDMRHFFARIVTTGAPMTEVLERVRDGSVDAGFLATCLIEDLDAIGLIDKNEFKVIHPRVLPKSGVFGCTASTELYASWILSVMPSLSSTLAEQITGALLRLKPQGVGSRWTVNLDRKGPQNVFYQLNVPFQESYGLRAFLYEQRRWVFAAVSMLALVLSNLAIMALALRVRTRQKEKAIEEKYQAQWMSEQYQLRLEALEKSRLVGTLSSLAAHELKQPLAVINNYAGTLRRRLQKASVSPEMLMRAVSEIESSGLKAADIVDHVRMYASGRLAKHESVDLRKLVRRVAESRAWRARVSVEAPESVCVMGDAMELELMVLNLVKNSCACVSDTVDPQVKIELSRTAEGACVAVTDNGPALSEDDIELIGRDFYTTKPDGLGLGIQLVRSLAESHGGLFTLKRSTLGGLCAEIRLPTAETQKRTQTN